MHHRKLLLSGCFDHLSNASDFGRVVWDKFEVKLFSLGNHVEHSTVGDVDTDRA